MTLLPEVLEQLERQAAEAERYAATARVDVLLRAVLEDLREVDMDGTESNGTEPDQLVNVHRAAELLDVKTRYLYEHHDRFPFTRRVGRQLRFSLRGLQRYIARRR